MTDEEDEDGLLPLERRIEEIERLLDCGNEQETAKARSLLIDALRDCIRRFEAN